MAKEKTAVQSGNDARIEFEISNLWLQYNFQTFKDLSVSSDEGRVLLTGIVPKDEWRVEAVRLAWQVDGVKEVINHIAHNHAEKFGDIVNDNWITAQLRTRLLFDFGVVSINYTIEVVKSTVYIIGIAQSPAELKRVIANARSVPGVREVIDCVRMKAQPMPQESEVNHAQ